MDGIPIGMGVLGGAYRSGRVEHLDVSNDAEFIASAPGLVAEVVGPLRIDDVVRAVFSVECTRSLAPAEVHEIERIGVELERALQRAGRDGTTTGTSSRCSTTSGATAAAPWSCSPCAARARRPGSCSWLTPCRADSGSRHEARGTRHEARRTTHDAMELLAGVVARTLDDVRVHDALRPRAERDSLTMVGSRGAFDDALAALDGDGGEPIAIVLAGVVGEATARVLSDRMVRADGLRYGAKAQRTVPAR